MGVLRLGKTSITYKIKEEALEQSCDPEDAVTTPLGRFDLVVQAFHETTTETVNHYRTAVAHILNINSK